MQTTRQHEHLHVWRCLRTRATLLVADRACAHEVRQTALPSRAHRNHNRPEPFVAEREPNARSSTYLTLSLSLFLCLSLSRLMSISGSRDFACHSAPPSLSLSLSFCPRPLPLSLFLSSLSFSFSPFPSSWTPAGQAYFVYILDCWPHCPAAGQLLDKQRL